EHSSLHHDGEWVRPATRPCEPTAHRTRQRSVVAWSRTPLRDQVVTSSDTQPASARGPKEYPCPELFEPLLSSLSEDSAAGVAAGAAEPRSSSSRSCDSRNPRSRVRYSRSIVR